MNKNIKNLLLTPFNVLYKISPKTELKLLFYIKWRQKLNLDDPKTYLDKLNWLKVYDRNPLMPICADKYKARAYIAEKGFGEYLPKLLWVGDKAEDIPFADLPNKFVIKSNSGSGNNIICKDKSSLDLKKAIKTAKKWLKEKYIPCYGEWMYNFIEPKIIIEEFLEDNENYVPIDYKLFYFNNLHGGNIGCVAEDRGRFIDHRRNIYDGEWNFLPEVNFNFKTDPEHVSQKPALFDKMKDIAKKLADGFPQMRVDFFIIQNKLYIGEMTFFNGAGFDMISPNSFHLKMGSWISLPKREKE